MSMDGALESPLAESAVSFLGFGATEESVPPTPSFTRIRTLPLAVLHVLALMAFEVEIFVNVFDDPRYRFILIQAILMAILVRKKEKKEKRRRKKRKRERFFSFFLSISLFFKFSSQRVCSGGLSFNLPQRALSSALQGLLGAIHQGQQRDENHFLLGREHDRATILPVYLPPRQHRALQPDLGHEDPHLYRKLRPADSGSDLHDDMSCP